MNAEERALRETWPKVQGLCPACHRDTLRLGDGGHVTCTWHECPEPMAAPMAWSRLRPPPFSVTYEAHPAGHGQGVGYLFGAMDHDLVGCARAHAEHMTPGDRAVLAKLCRVILLNLEAADHDAVRIAQDGESTHD